MTEFAVCKLNDEQQIVYGWASLIQNPDGTPLVDRQGDIILPDELEKAAHEFVLKSRQGGVMHERTGVAKLVASFVTTPELVKALFPTAHAGTVPVGWVVGFKVTDPTVWKRVKDGELTMFSIHGTGERVPVEA